MIDLRRAERYARVRARPARRAVRHFFRSLKGERRLFLTFDDGPTPDLPCVLDLLTQYQAKATFFVIGQQVTDETIPVLARALNDGHLVGSHSWSHADLSKCGPDRIRCEIRLADAALSRVLQAAGVDDRLRPKLFRYPYLRAGDRLRRRIAGQAFRELGYKLAPCHVDTADWRLPAGTITFEEVERRALTAGRGDVVLLHETAFTAQLLERLLPVLAGRYELCSLAGTVSSPRPGEIADDGLRENRQKESPAHPSGDS